MTDIKDFSAIIILTNARSGSNLLAEMLGLVRGNLRLLEIFHPVTRGYVSNNKAFFAGLQTNLGCNWSDIDDPNLGEVIDRDKVGYFKALCETAQKLGYDSLSCKMFVEQIKPSDLSKILSQSNVRVIFLTRRRIDREISAQKAWMTKTYIGQDTTKLLPMFDVKNFLRQARDVDNGMEQFWTAVQAASLPYTVMDYDRDINIEEDLRSKSLAKALGEIGISQELQVRTAPKWLVKQDTNTDWRNKVSNGFAVATSLAGLGLLEYAESAPLMDFLPVKRDAPAFRGNFQKDANLNVASREQLMSQGGYWRAFSKDPMLTLTSIQFGRSFFAEWMVGARPVFDASLGVHFLKPTWSMQTKGLDALGQTLRQAEQDNPGHIFIALHVNKAEEENYRRSGIRSILGNIGIFEDESIWAENAPALPNVPNTDALMIAALVAWKNHHLAAEVDSVNLVYGKPLDQDLTRVRGLCPNANFVNHRTGVYTYLQRQEMQAVMSRSKVFLALSKEEGTMRAAIESLLSGLPIVSPPSIGGRDAFFVSDNSLIVDASPQAIRNGVKVMVARNLTREQVRRATLGIIRPMRNDFEKVANQAIAAHLGPMAPELRVRDVFGLLTKYQTLRDFVSELT